jgi:hypothetical protein
MHRISAGLATCLVAAVTVGCGTAQAGQPRSPGHANTPATPGNPGQQPGARAASSCQGAGPAGSAAQTLVITLADNGKIYCVRVGDKLSVDLRSTDTSSWLQPLASSGALVPIPDGANSLVKGLTAGSFAAVRPGQALVTSVRPPCQVTISAGKGDLQPADSIPRAYPLRFCAPGHRFSASVIVVR